MRGYVAPISAITLSSGSWPPGDPTASCGGTIIVSSYMRPPWVVGSRLLPPLKVGLAIDRRVNGLCRSCSQAVAFGAMSTETEAQTQVHGGRLIAQRLRAHGVSKLFTLSGGHLFSIYDGCREEGIDIVDVRHEQTAAFAAEGWAKVTREPGVA